MWLEGKLEGGESIHVDFFGGEGIAEGGLVCSCSEVEGCGIELQERMLDAFKRRVHCCPLWRIGLVFVEFKSPLKGYDPCLVSSIWEGNGELIDHLFLHCPVTIGLWHKLFNLAGFGLDPSKEYCGHDGYCF
ncbi:hypothetical protein CK203_034103 [Vitis vinifera]|uniref:Reverse transcriptase zinc-binding domain-containing protein n=1 Tax=Vitis vinifera TaxID=29760 RepID=A0A438IBD9_VITVI|nr:hypothetical protein CK203_034103 [Vitis vinifera]